MNLTCKVCKLSSIYDTHQEGTKYVHVSCRGCKTDFLCCMDCELHIDLRNRTFVRFGRTPASHMRQHLKIAQRHASSDKEMPTQDCPKGTRQPVEYAEVYSHEDHDLVDEHDIFGDSGGCGVDCNDKVIFTKMILVIVNQWRKIIWITKICSIHYSYRMQRITS